MENDVVTEAAGKSSVRGRPGAVPEFAGGRIFRKQSPWIRFG